MNERVVIVIDHLSRSLPWFIISCVSLNAWQSISMCVHTHIYRSMPSNFFFRLLVARVCSNATPKEVCKMWFPKRFSLSMEREKVSSHLESWLAMWTLDRNASSSVSWSMRNQICTTFSQSRINYSSNAIGNYQAIDKKHEDNDEAAPPCSFGSRRCGTRIWTRKGEPKGNGSSKCSASFHVGSKWRSPIVFAFVICSTELTFIKVFITPICTDFLLACTFFLTHYNRPAKKMGQRSIIESCPTAIATTETMTMTIMTVVTTIHPKMATGHYGREKLAVDPMAARLPKERVMPARLPKERAMAAHLPKERAMAAHLPKVGWWHVLLQFTQSNKLSSMKSLDTHMMMRCPCRLIQSHPQKEEKEDLAVTARADPAKEAHRLEKEVRARDTLRLEKEARHLAKEALRPERQAKEALRPGRQAKEALRPGKQAKEALRPGRQAKEALRPAKEALRLHGQVERVMAMSASTAKEGRSSVAMKEMPSMTTQMLSLTPWNGS